MMYELNPPVPPDAVDDVADLQPTRTVAPPGTVFPQSVASGGPSPTGVILWTRIGPAVYDPDQSLTVEVAADADFTDVRYRGAVEPSEVTPDHDYTVKVDLDGRLDADSTYYYRFEYRGTRSRTGRCRTLPAPDSSPERVRLAVLSCQHYQNGYFPAYHHVAHEDVDFLVHLGDFIYETARDQYKGLGSKVYPGRDLSFPSGHDVVWTLDDFRYLYRTYLSDGFMQEALERHTIIRGWDDHAIANNRYWDYETDAPVAPNHPRGHDAEFMRQLTVDGIQAWWEYTPARIEYDPDADHLQKTFRLWRTYEFGDLATLVMTDERLFRTEPLCAETFLPKWAPVCSVSHDPDRTMLGEEQREWFLDQLDAARSTWTVWGNEVLTLPLRLGVGPLSVYPKMDSWDGYASERDTIMAAVQRSPVENFVTITGDMHSYVAGYQQLEYPDPLRVLVDGPGAGADKRVGVEFMTPAISSVNIAEAMGVQEGRLGELTERLLLKTVRTLVPHVEFFDSHHWGYSVVEFTPTDCTYRAYSIDKRVNSPRAAKTLLAAIRVPEGRVELHRLPTGGHGMRSVATAGGPAGTAATGERLDARLHRLVEFGREAGVLPLFRPTKRRDTVDIDIEARSDGDERIERPEN